jgi:hypothetical protein
MGGYAGGVSLYAYQGELRYEYSGLLIKRDKIKVGMLPDWKGEDRARNEDTFGASRPRRDRFLDQRKGSGYRYG